MLIVTPSPIRMVVNHLPQSERAFHAISLTASMKQRKRPNRGVNSRFERPPKRLNDYRVSVGCPQTVVEQKTVVHLINYLSQNHWRVIRVATISENICRDPRRKGLLPAVPSNRGTVPSDPAVGDNVDCTWSASINRQSDGQRSHCVSRSFAWVALERQTQDYCSAGFVRAVGV